MPTHLLRALLLFAVSIIFSLGLHAEIDLKAIDTSVRPQDDFFDYANGTWLKTLEIPADQLGWAVFMS